MVAEVLDERLAFLFRHIGEAVRADDVDEERLAAGLRMRDDDRMLTFRHVVVVAQAQLAGTGGVALRRTPVRQEAVVMDGLHPFQHPLHSVGQRLRSEEHTSELQSLMRISYAVFCLKKKKI